MELRRGHSCVFVRWAGASNMILANNALYCPGSAAVNGSGLTGSGLTISSNYFEGALSGAAADGSRLGPGFKQGGSGSSNRAATPTSVKLE